MASITLTTRGATEATAFSGRRVQAVLAGWALLMVAAFVVLLLAAQSGQHTTDPSALTQGLVQQVSAINSAPEPGYLRGRPC
jgi:hypothetical protein